MRKLYILPYGRAGSGEERDGVSILRHSETSQGFGGWARRSRSPPDNYFARDGLASGAKIASERYGIYRPFSPERSKTIYEPTWYTNHKQPTASCQYKQQYAVKETTRYKVPLRDMPRGVAQEQIENHTARVWHKYNKRYGISAYYCCTYRHTLLELYLHFRKQKRSWKPCGTTTPLLLTESFYSFSR